MSTFGIPNIAPDLEAHLVARMAEVESLLRSHTRSEYPFVDETAHHLVSAGGKRLRPLLTLLTSQYGDPTGQEIIAAAVACEITHLATLYHDDVMDEAPLRRGVESTETVTVFGEKIGVAFQLADDVIDIASESNQSGKTPGTDLREGVPTLVTLNVMKSKDSADSELKQLLAGPIEDESTVQQVLVELRTHKALDESRQQLHDIAKQARLALGPLPVNDATGALMSLCDAVIDRSV